MKWRDKFLLSEFFGGILKIIFPKHFPLSASTADHSFDKHAWLIHLEQAIPPFFHRVKFELIFVTIVLFWFNLWKYFSWKKCLLSWFFN